MNSLLGRVQRKIFERIFYILYSHQELLMIEVTFNKYEQDSLVNEE
jgi:hypothetical protein